MTDKYLIFDYDGVLADTYEAMTQAKMRMFSCTREEAELDTDRFVARPHHARQNNLTFEELAKYKKFVKYLPQFILEANFELFHDFISEIKKINGSTKAIISSGSINYITPKISEIDLSFSHILGFEDHHSKEEKTEWICRDWGIAPTDAYFFTDASSDIIEMKNIMDSQKIIGCAWGFQAYDQLRKHLPDNQILKNFSDIHKIFD